MNGGHGAVQVGPIFSQKLFVDLYNASVEGNLDIYIGKISF